MGSTWQILNGITRSQITTSLSLPETFMVSGFTTHGDLGAGAIYTSQGATSGPTKGTGATNSTAGDSFVSQTSLSGAFDATAWTFNWIMRATVVGCVGRVRLRV